MGTASPNIIRHCASDIGTCVPNAGIATGKAAHKTDMDFWRDMMATNLDGAFLTVRDFLEVKAPQGGQILPAAHRVDSGN